MIPIAGFYYHFSPEHNCALLQGRPEGGRVMYLDVIMISSEVYDFSLHRMYGRRGGVLEYIFLCYSLGSIQKTPEQIR